MGNDTEILIMRLGSSNRRKDRGVIIASKKYVEITNEGVIITGRTFSIPYDKLTEELKYDVRSLYPIEYPIKFFESLKIYFVHGDKKNIVSDIPNTLDSRPPEMDSD